MPRPHVLDMGTSHITEHSLADNAAKVRFGNGVVGVVELFRSDSIVEFRGLPSHLADGDRMQIEIQNDLGMGDNAVQPTTEEEQYRLAVLQNKILFEFAIGIR